MSYQAIYDAAMQQLDMSWVTARAQEAITAVWHDYTKPSVLYRPKLSLDGDQWIALYGENIQEGVVGVGVSPQLAMDDFDAAWNRKVNQQRTVQP